MRNMSFALTTEQLLNGIKTVTRRLGWKNLKPGDRLCAVRKSQGLKKGEKVERLAIIEVTRVTREPLWYINSKDDDLRNYYGPDEVKAEGFPQMSVDEFVDMFCKHNNCTPETEVTRIEFKVVQYL